MSGFPTPYARYEGVVQPEWIDLNGHMNLAYYLVMFDHALDAICAEFDLDWEYTRRTNLSTFVVETHTMYQQELLLGERALVHSWVLGVDHKRLHIAQEMYRLPDMTRSACWEAMMLHVDLNTRKVSPWPAAQRARLDDAAAAHAAVPQPDWVGRKVQMRR